MPNISSLYQNSLKELSNSSYSRVWINIGPNLLIFELFLIKEGNVHFFFRISVIWRATFFFLFLPSVSCLHLFKGLSLSLFQALEHFQKNLLSNYYRRLSVLLVGHLFLKGLKISHFIMKSYFYKSLMTPQERFQSQKRKKKSAFNLKKNEAIS